jgi:hypothetical protein
MRLMFPDGRTSVLSQSVWQCSWTVASGTVALAASEINLTHGRPSGETKSNQTAGAIGKLNAYCRRRTTS